ncbi:universal stress protein UspA [Halalkaliarchaeum desulfuricum]|uniref:Universal stress protein UspA n=1 Tax=Halalkaliarchaeum desulfuricum TaxID=2055893 RepID=A0A343TLX7_9EURY|nr:universal stress protein [Halalkaliarchaeum desulfuricum]AUX10099.1 universal stress protein UspA [Halalkaliarchaeum desulfuricum]
MYRKILIPTDGSDEAEAAAEKGVELAAELGAQVHALYVIDPEVGGQPFKLQRKEEGIEELRERGLELTGRVADIAAEAGVDCEQAVEQGKPYDAIVDYTEENDLDAIVIGTRGRGNIESFLVGNVTEKVMRTADVPVMTVRTSEKPV